MTSLKRLETIRLLLERDLPERLKDKKLKNFDAYKVGQVQPTPQNVCTVISHGWSFDAESEVYGVGVIFQLYSSDLRVYAYESVIVPAVADILQPRSIDMAELDSIDSMVTPVGKDNSVQIAIKLVFIEPLDTVDYMARIGSMDKE